MMNRAVIVAAVMACTVAGGCSSGDDPGAVGTTGNAPDAMVWIPGGEFAMGSTDPDARPDEQPVHRVRVDGFWMDITEVTNKQFAAFVAATGYVTTAQRKPDWEELKKQLPPGTPKPPDDVLVAGSLVFTQPARPVPLTNAALWWAWVPGADWQHPQGPDSSIEGKDDYPVVQVSHDDALAYCRWAGKRLPTEAQWEFAARGGLAHSTYAWGDAPYDPTRANIWNGQFPTTNTASDGFVGTAPVKSFPANGYGLYDMAGNVWEWCSDWYRHDAYALAERVDADGVRRNPQGPVDSFDPMEPTVPKRSQRGGSFLCNDSYCAGYRPSARMKASPDTGLSHTGFRCVKDAPVLGSTGSTGPTIVAGADENDKPLAWGALSGLACDSDNIVYAVHDRTQRKSCIYTMDVRAFPAIISGRLAIRDADNVLRDALQVLKVQLPGTDDFDPDKAINKKDTVDLGLEGVAMRSDGGWWVVSEGVGNLRNGSSDPDNQRFESPNMLIGVTAGGVIDSVVQLPLALARNQLRYGLEGVAEAGGMVYVIFQRAWRDAGDPSDQTRIGRYDPNTGEWMFAYYQLDRAARGWVGLSELTHVRGAVFLVIERDNQSDAEATIKRVYRIDLSHVVFKSNDHAGRFDVITAKELVYDLLKLPQFSNTGQWMPEKWEGMTILPGASGDVLIVNDSDGEDDFAGETQLMRLSGTEDA